jgi:hypothetical protein
MRTATASCEPPGGTASTRLWHARMHCSMSGFCWCSRAVVAAASASQRASRKFHGTSAGRPRSVGTTTAGQPRGVGTEHCRAARQCCQVRNQQLVS